RAIRYCALRPSVPLKLQGLECVVSYSETVSSHVAWHTSVGVVFNQVHMVTIIKKISKSQMVHALPSNQEHGWNHAYAQSKTATRLRRTSFHNHPIVPQLLCTDTVLPRCLALASGYCALWLLLPCVVHVGAEFSCCRMAFD